MYAFLNDLGFRTTKSVWPIRGRDVPKLGGTTCEDSAYLDWVRTLQAQGFEIGLHNVTYHTSYREDIVRGIDRFEDLFGHAPRVHANHYGCTDAMYWGKARLTGAHQWLYRLLTAHKRNGDYGGHVAGDPRFWGDICRDRIDYVRNFAYGNMNTLEACPYMPYHDPQRPYVNNWFASSEGAEVNSFVRTISEHNQDRLAAGGGGCIMYTHFAFSFYRDGRLHSRFKALMERLSKMNGWFVPVSQLLDHLHKEKGSHQLTDRERASLERRWLLHKVRTRGTT